MRLGTKGTTFPRLWLVLVAWLLTAGAYGATMTASPTPTLVKTVRMLVPSDDLTKLLSEDARKFVVLSWSEFEQMRARKEGTLIPVSPQTIEPPIRFRVRNVWLKGRVNEGFAEFEAELNIESFSDQWQSVEIISGPIAVTAHSMSGDAILAPVTFPRPLVMPKLGDPSRRTGFSTGLIPFEERNQENWPEVSYRVSLRGKQVHRLTLSFLTPIFRERQKSRLRFSLLPVPVTSFHLAFPEYHAAIDESSFLDFHVEPDKNPDANGSLLVAWLGGRGEVSLSWRERARPKPVPFTPPPPPVPMVASATVPVNASAAIAVPAPVEVIVTKAPPKPRTHTRSETLITIGEGALQGKVRMDFSVAKAPLKTLEIFCEEDLDILSVSSDRPKTHVLRKNETGKILHIEFAVPREDAFGLEILYELKLDESKTRFRLPEIRALDVVQDTGVLALQSLISLEVQPVDDPNPAAELNAFRIDAGELPEGLKKQFVRPILLAYRYISRPFQVELEMKRFGDITQQTVVADLMDVRTTFTTTESSKTQLRMKIRNNNRQFIALQLASQAEVLSAFLDDKPVTPVKDKIPGKILVPIKTSKSLGQTQGMDLRLTYKENVATMSVRGSLEFAGPLVDVPVSRLAWTLFAPANYMLYDFRGTIRQALTPKDPFVFRGFVTIFDYSWALVKKPETLLFFGVLVILVLFILARNLLLALLEMIWKVLWAILSAFFSGGTFRLAHLAIAIGIIAMLSAIATPNFKKAREQAREKSCYANMRVLQGAVEMFNMDHTEMMKTLTISQLTGNAGYLKGSPTCPHGERAYFSVGDLSNAGIVVCPVHGAVEHSDAELARMRTDSESSVVAHASRQTSASSKASEGADWVGNDTAKDKGFRAARAKGVAPIESKLVTTSNFFTLERELVLADVASSGMLVANRTCPEVRFSYMRWELFESVRILGFMMGILMGMYFVLGAHFGHSLKFLLAGGIMAGLLLAERRLPVTGDLANQGLWIVLIGGIIWKIFLYLQSQGSFSSGPDDDSSPTLRKLRPMQSPTGPSDDFDDSLPPSGPPNPSTPPTPPTPRDPRPPVSPTGGAATIILLVLLPIWGMSSPVWGDEAATQRKTPQAAGAYGSDGAREIRIMVPFQDLNEVIEAQDKAVILPEEDFRYLSEVAAPPAPEEVHSPLRYQVRSAVYHGRIEERGVRFNARFAFEVFAEEWMVVPFLAAGTVPSKALLDNEPAALDAVPEAKSAGGGFGVYVNTVGSHVLDVDFFVPTDDGADAIHRRFALPILPVTLTVMEIELPSEEMTAHIDPGKIRFGKTAEGKPLVIASLPPCNSVLFEYFHKSARLAEPVPPIEPEKPSDSLGSPEKKPEPPKEMKVETRVSVRESVLFSFEDAGVKGIGKYQLDVTGTDGIASFAFRVPKEFTVLEVQAPNKEDFTLKEDGAYQILEIAFLTRMKGQVPVQVHFEENFFYEKETSYTIREILPQGTDRMSGVLGIAALPIFQPASPVGPEGYDPIDPNEFLQEFKTDPAGSLFMAFKFLRHGNLMTFPVTRTEAQEMQTAIVEKAESRTILNEDGFILTRIVYQVLNSSEQFLKVRLPLISGVPGELWSSEVAFQAVKAGYDAKHQVYTIPIILSPVVNETRQPFPVEIVVVHRLPGRIAPFSDQHFELPQVHLDVNELIWELALPEGYELMKGTANVDLSPVDLDTSLLDGSAGFPWLQGTTRGASADDRDRLLGFMGLLPVKFQLPTVSWKTSYSRLQIEPGKPSPFISGMLVTPRQGKGRVFSWMMILLGAVCGLSALFLGTRDRKILWLFVLALGGIFLGVAVVFKLYQADHSFKMGFMLMFVGSLLLQLFRWQPPVGNTKR
jgi:competence protein ComGC